MIKVFCDRCGSSMFAAGKIGVVALGKMDGLLGEAEYGSGFEHSHFCVKCMDEIERFIQKMPATEPAATEEPEGSSDGAGQKATKKVRVRLDMGKVMALKNAGWSNAKIADEMKTTKTAIANAICRQLKRDAQGRVNNE